MSDAAAAELNLLQARIELLRERLRLAALAGDLDEDQLQAVNAGLPLDESAGKSMTRP